MAKTVKSRRPGFSGRVVAFAVRAFPARFRGEFATEIVDAFLDHRDDIRSGGRPRLVAEMAVLFQLLKTTFDLTKTGLAERLADRRPGKRATKRDPMIRVLLADLAYSARALLKQPAFTLIAVVTLALGIGANTAIFSVLNSVVLTPLPYDEPEDLVRVYTSRITGDGANFLSGPDVVALSTEVASLEGMGAMYTYREMGRDLMSSTGPVRVKALPVNADYFSVYRATPLMGRTFADNDEFGMKLAVLSHTLWQNHAGADEDIVGKSIDLNGEPYTVIGVIRPTFRDVIGGDVDVWVSIDKSPDSGWDYIDNHYLTGVARLATGVSIQQAQAEINTLQQSRRTDGGNDHYDEEMLRLTPLFDDVVGESSTTIIVLMGAAGLVLLIACANVANLFLTRGIARTKEMAIRTALGSSRSRLFLQLMGESLVIAFAGGAAGLAVSTLGVRGLLAISPDSLARAEEISFEPALLLFAMVATVATALVFGTAPAVRAARTDPNDALRDGTRGSTGGVGGRRLRNALVVSQMAFAMLLLIGAGLLMRSFVRLQQTDLGMNPDNVFTFETHLPEARYNDPARRIQYYISLHERLRALPGVEAAAAVSKLPASGPYNDWGMGFMNASGEREWFGAQVRVIEGDYFDAFRIPLLSGRLPNAGDTPDGIPVIVVNQATAERAFPDSDPLGEIVRIGGKEWTIVGVVTNVAHDHLGSIDEKVYLPHSQYGEDRNWAVTQVVRTGSPTPGILEDVRRVVTELDGQLVVHNPRQMDAVLGREVARDKFATLLMAIFAGVALALSAIGIYGVLSYTVTQRFNEIGIRVALGATAVQVRNLVLKQVVLLGAIGLGIGLAGALAGGRVLESMLFEVGVRDPVVFGSVTASLAFVALLAGWVPAHRATTVSPMAALREE